jgi:hypothetical protein
MKVIDWTDVHKCSECMEKVKEKKLSLFKINFSWGVRDSLNMWTEYAICENCLDKTLVMLRRTKGEENGKT